MKGGATTGDDVPTISRSAAPCGSPDNPHVVPGPLDLVCVNCETDLGAELLRREVESLRGRS